MATSYSNQLAIILDRLDEQTSPSTARKILDAVVAKQQGDVDEYPSASSANRRPGNNGYSWYVRGFGTRTVTGKAYPTSEQFGQRWTQQRQGDFKKLLINNASYAGYLMGDPQVGWAKSVGWQDMGEVIRENADEYRMLAARVLARVNNG